MKQLVLLAIVAVSIVGATTAFATSNFINITAVQGLGASNDVNIPEDISVGKINFATCQNYFGLPVPAGGTTSCPANTPATVIYGISDCVVTDTTDAAIPAGEVVTCKLTSEPCVAGVPNPTACTPGATPTVVGEGQLTVAIANGLSNIGGTVNAAGSVSCTAAVPCNIDVPISTPGPVVDIQTVGDVKIIAKGPAV